MLLLFRNVIADTYILGRRLYSDGWVCGRPYPLPLPGLLPQVDRYRTDNLWVALWHAALVVMTGGPSTLLRSVFMLLRRR